MPRSKRSLKNLINLGHNLMTAMAVVALMLAGCGPHDELFMLDTTTVVSPLTTGYAGMDISAYPGSEKMQWLKKTNLQFTGFYLGDGGQQAPHHPGKDWMLSRKTLQDMGWGLAPLYVGRQQSAGPSYPSDLAIMTKALGMSDGQSAANLMVQAGFPRGSVIYLDVETGPPVYQQLKDYYRGWNDAVVTAGYVPGVYCSYLTADTLRLEDNRPIFWVFRVSPPKANCLNSKTTIFPTSNPSESGIPYAMVWQLHSQDCPQQMNESGTTANIDYDVANIPDPSKANPIPTTPEPPFSPANWQVVVGNTFQLIWSTSPRAASYQVIAYNWTGTSWAIYGVLSGNQSRLLMSNLPWFTTPGYIAWAVRACNSWGCSALSPWQYAIYRR